MAGLPQYPEALQPAPGFGAVLLLAVGQAVGQGAVGMAELENVDRSGVVNAAGPQVTEGCRRTEQGRVVVVDDLGERLGVAGVGGER